MDRRGRPNDRVVSRERRQRRARRFMFVGVDAATVRAEHDKALRRRPRVAEESLARISAQVAIGDHGPTKALMLDP
jgi:hypothetical protein